MEFCKIEVFSHFFKLTDVSSDFAHVVASFAWKQTTKKLIKQGRAFISVPDKTYGYKSLDSKEFRFHRHHLDAFTIHCAENRFKLIPEDFVHQGMYEPAVADMKLSPNWKARDNQVPIIDYVLAPGACKTVNLQTGQGKTSCSLKAGELLGTRMMVMVLGRYYDKWITDVAEQYSLPNDKVMFAKGTKQLKKLLALSFREDFDPDVIIVSLGTVVNYIKEYTMTGFENEPDHVLPPDQLWQQLGIGYRITDEVHQHFYSVFSIDLHTHLPKAVNLSATLKSSDPLVQKMMGIAFPMSTRINGGKYIKVSDCKAVHYHLKETRGIRCTGFAKSYSHVVYEEWLTAKKQEKVWGNYLELIRELVVDEYINHAKEGQKMLIFAAKVETCELIREYLQALFPDKVISKYTSDDLYDTFSDSDIVVSTIGSSGTAIDIPGLITVLMTTCINSEAANEQALGRLRDLRIPGFNPMFLYFCCDDIPKQKEYAKNKIEKFADKVYTHKNIYYDKKL